MRRLLVWGVMVVSCTAQAGPAADEAAAYEVVRVKGLTCKAKYELGALRVQNGQITAQEAYREFLTCRNGVTAEAKAVYGKVMPKLKRADAKKALKDYQVALMTFLEGVEPKHGETNGQYGARLAALDSALDIAWQRLQLEL